MELLTQHDSEGPHPLMSSSPIAAIVGHRPAGTAPPAAVTDCERQGLLAALAAVADPRDPRGIRYPLASMLATAVCAVMAGACTFTAMADWVRDLDPPAWAKLGFTGKLPVPSMLWRLLTRVDDTELSVVVTRWVRACTASVPVSGRCWRRVIAIDGKVLRGAKLPDRRQVHLLSALDTSSGTVLAYVQIAVKSNEIPAFTPLLDLVAAQLGSLEGIVFVADALHAQTAHAHEVASRGAYLMVAVKANQPTLFAQLKGLPWGQVPVGDRRTETGHGRRETRTVKAVTVATPGGLGFPHAEQAIRITRTRTVKGKTTRGMAYLTMSLPAEDAQPVDLGAWARSEWHIENRLHWVLDVTFREDEHQARTGTGAAVASVLRHAAINYHRSNGEANIARATRRANRRSNDLIDAVTSSYPTTQWPCQERADQRPLLVGNITGIRLSITHDQPNAANGQRL